MGRPSLGRKNKVTLYLTDDEKRDVREFLETLRTPSAIFTALDVYASEQVDHRVIELDPASLYDSMQRGYKPE